VIKKGIIFYYSLFTIHSSLSPMIAKKNRFTTKLFDRLFRRSKKMHVGNFLFLVSDARGEARFSVVVGKKTSKLAVDRNRLRRQLYEIIREKMVPAKLNKNVILLYKGSKILENPAEFKHACTKLISLLS
jgi:ribonuclease P protein component